MHQSDMMIGSRGASVAIPSLRDSLVSLEHTESLVDVWIH
jgi:hypothetical protein